MRLSNGWVQTACIAVLAICGSAPHAAAQVLYGSIVGSVSDASSAAIAGAEVTLTNKETGQSRKTATKHASEYGFPALSAGSYNITVANERVPEFHGKRNRSWHRPDRPRECSSSRRLDHSKR